MAAEIEKLIEKMALLEPVVLDLGKATEGRPTAEVLLAFGYLLGRWCYASGQEEGPLIEVIRGACMQEQQRLLITATQATKQ